MSKGQSTARAIRRGNIDRFGNKLSRPFSNRKRTKGAGQQVAAEKYYKYMKKRMEEYKLIQDAFQKVMEAKKEELEIKEITEDGSESI